MFKMSITEINFSFRVWCALETAKVDYERQSYWWKVKKTGLQQARKAHWEISSERVSEVHVPLGRVNSHTTNPHT